MDGWIDHTEEHITDKAIEDSAAKVLPANTVLVALYGATVGKLGMLRRPMTCNQACCAMVVRNEIANPRYIFYQLLRHREQLKSQAVGAAQQNLSGLFFRSFEIPFPPIKEQGAIARVLGSLDDKIELNRRMNQSLEQIAQALFKSWFVDFDPVRAKAEGLWKKGESLPGMPADMWDLWPSEFEESEIGEIPKGWEVAGLLDLASLLSGGTPSTEEPSYWDGGIPWVSGKDVSAARGGFILHTERTVSEEGIANSATKRLPARTVVITARGTVGALAILASEMCISQTNYGLKAADGVGDDFLFFTVRSAIDGLQQESYGTIFDTITTRNLRGTRVVQPPPVVLARFEGEVEPLMQRVFTNLHEAGTLSATRDALLPKLLSGEIRVPVNGGK